MLLVLGTRGVEVSEDVRTRVTECSGLERLTTWLRRAATAASARDPFDRGR